MITGIFGPPRVGKTSLMVYLLTLIAFDFERTAKMQKAIRERNLLDGINRTIPDHTASANFEITFKKLGYRDRYARVIDPKRLAFAEPGTKPHFLLPWQAIGIMEAQQFFNSRKFAEFSASQSNVFEQHGHLHLDFYLDTQRPGLIDLNIRELMNFIEVRNMKINNNKDGFFESVAWTVREFANIGLVDEYMKSGKQDSSLYVEKLITSAVDVRTQYNSWSLEDRFYEGHEKEDYDLFYKMQDLKDAKKYLEDIKAVA